MRITYRQLQKIVSNFSESQLDSDVRVFHNEIGDTLAADLLISGDEQEYGLGKNCPVFRMPYDQGGDRATDEQIDNYIQTIRADGGFGKVRDAQWDVE